MDAPAPGSGDADPTRCHQSERPVEPADRAGRPWLHRVGERIGKALFGIGAVVLSFLAFQLWGTAVQHHQAQDDLADELARTLAQAESGRVSGASPVDANAGGGPASIASLEGLSGSSAGRGETQSADVVVVPDRPRPDPGAAVARIEAPTIGLDKTVVEGVGRPQLRAGPGLYPISPLPGHRGNVAIAGHRTTHGSPFAALDQLQPGDPIVLETVDGVFTYRVEGQHTAGGDILGHRIVEPDAVDVIADLGDSRLTLTSCHPRYSDRQRLIVTAVLDGPAVVFPPAEPAARALVADRLQRTVDAERPGGVVGPNEGQPVDVASPGATGLDEPLGWQLDQLSEAVWWALILVVSLVPAILLRRRRRRFLAFAALVVLASFPLVALLSAVDTMAPAW